MTDAERFAHLDIDPYEAPAKPEPIQVALAAPLPQQPLNFDGDPYAQQAAYTALINYGQYSPQQAYGQQQQVDEARRRLGMGLFGGLFGNL